MDYGFPSQQFQEFPSMVQLSIDNRCDMICRMCPHTDYVVKDDFVPISMDYDLFKKIADEVGENHQKIYEEIGDHTGSMRLLGWGEALMHERIVDMVGYAKDAGVNIVSMITNGKRLDAQKSRGLLEAGLDVIEVSLDAFTEQNYELIRRNKNFERIKDQVINYVALREELGSGCYVAVGIIDQPQVHDEISAFKEFWSQHVDDVVIRRFRDFKGHVEDGVVPDLSREAEPCRCLWARFNITPSGLATICYDDWDEQSVIGDLNDPDTTIMALWHSEDLENERQAHLEGKIYSDICGQCQLDRLASSWKEPYEQLFKRIQSWKKQRISQ